MRIVWDEPKRLSTLDKHGLDLAQVNEAFFLSAAIVPTKKSRFMAVGRLGDDKVVVVFAFLGSEGVSLITMRRANSKERRMLG